jgi:hypothetical protein
MLNEKIIKYVITVFLLILFIQPAAHTQTISLRVNSGINFFNMKDLKEYQGMMNVNWFGTKAVKSFPPYFNYQLQATLLFSQHIEGGIYTDYTSTGGRLDYKDYSGEIRFDQVVSRISVGALFEYKIFQVDMFSINLSSKLSYQTSKLKFESSLQIQGDTQNSMIEYTSDGLGIEPGVAAGFTYSLFLIRLEASYQLSFCGAYSSEGHKLNNVSEAFGDISPEWNSFKLAITFGVTI